MNGGAHAHVVIDINGAAWQRLPNPTVTADQWRMLAQAYAGTHSRHCCAAYAMPLSAVSAQYDLCS